MASSRARFINDFVVEERERERKRWRHHERVLYINDFYSIKEKRGERLKRERDDDDDANKKKL